ncbi:MAG: AAA family ATPase [Acidobacteria bacterium]|nr:AAA family ATPase [Acidobacteriota bacterium]
MRRKLPLGVQTFRKIREENRYYVDKTGYALRFAEEGDHYSLARPRRFGKSLFVDTLKELFEGSEPLFRGLAVHGEWDWSAPHPVVRLDFGSGDFKQPGYLQEDAAAQLAAIERREGMAPEQASVPVRFRRLLEALHRRAGYTDADLDRVFAPELTGLDRERIRDWYNGYNWLGEERVYNPFGILQLFRNRRFRPYWFETGTPSFLVETLIEKQVRIPTLDGMRSDDELLSRFDVEDIAPEALLFQTGYLTILAEEQDFDGTPRYWLGYPNHEVRRSLNKSLLAALAPNSSAANPVPPLPELLRANDFATIRARLEALFHSIPREWHTRNEIARYEGYYASVFYAWLTAAGLDLTAEDSSSAGRADLVARFGGNVYLFEFKVVEQASTGAALAQLRSKGYADKYRPQAAEVHLIGVEFSKEQRNVVAFETALA